MTGTGTRTGPLRAIITAVVAVVAAVGLVVVTSPGSEPEYPSPQIRPSGNFVEFKLTWEPANAQVDFTYRVPPADQHRDTTSQSPWETPEPIPYDGKGIVWIRLSPMNAPLTKTSCQIIVNGTPLEPKSNEGNSSISCTYNPTPGAG